MTAESRPGEEISSPISGEIGSHLEKLIGQEAYQILADDLAEYARNHSEKLSPAGLVFDYARFMDRTYTNHPKVSELTRPLYLIAAGLICEDYPLAELPIYTLAEDKIAEVEKLSDQEKDNYRPLVEKVKAIGGKQDITADQEVEKGEGFNWEEDFLRGVEGVYTVEERQSIIDRLHILTHDYLKSHPESDEHPEYRRMSYLLQTIGFNALEQEDYLIALMTFGYSFNHYQPVNETDQFMSQSCINFIKTFNDIHTNPDLFSISPEVLKRYSNYLFVAGHFLDTEQNFRINIWQAAIWRDVQNVFNQLREKGMNQRNRHIKLGRFVEARIKQNFDRDDAQRPEELAIIDNLEKAKDLATQLLSIYQQPGESA